MDSIHTRGIIRISYNLLSVFNSRVGHAALMREIRNVYKILVRKILVRPRHRWEDNIRMEPGKTLRRCRLDSYGSV
jgi:hypothetical protein